MDIRVTQPIIYLDHHATTPLLPVAAEAMDPYWQTHFGNPHSKAHSFGVRAAHAVEHARGQIAAGIGADPKDIVLLSGATEANNLFLQGASLGYLAHGPVHGIVSSIEHSSVLQVCVMLQARFGVEITVLPVNQVGLVDPAAFQAAIKPHTRWASIQLANGEIGTIQPIARLGQMCRDAGIWLHTDAAQAVGQIPVDVDALGVASLSISAHKLGGPKGIGALYRRRKAPRVQLEPLLLGGGQEGGLRAGTVAVPLGVGMGAAIEHAVAHISARGCRVGKMRDRLWQELQCAIKDVRLHGPNMDERLPGNLMVSIPGIRSEQILRHVQGVAISTGSACASSEMHSDASHKGSSVLRALGCDAEIAQGALRLGVGACNDVEQMVAVADRIQAALSAVKA